MQSIYALSIENRPQKTTDEWILQKEELLLGVALTRLKLKGAKLEEANTVCTNFDKPKRDCAIAIHVQKISIKKQKDGKTMAFVSGLDSLGNETSAICLFAETYEKFSDIVYPNGNYLFKGYVSDRQSFITQKVEHLE
jgi:DNA polymerase III alpha subunit